MRVQNLHSASKNSQPRACLPFASVNSEVSEIMMIFSPRPLCRWCAGLPTWSGQVPPGATKLLSSSLGLPCPQQRNDFAPQLYDALRSEEHTSELQSPQ